MQLELSTGILDLNETQVMGVLNATPDSFSDGGRHNRLDFAIEHAHRMADAGAALIDIGGESTRPGAAEVSAAEEIDRVVPIIEALRPSLNVPISLDTSKPEVMRAGIAAGAAMLNDVRSLTHPGALSAAAELDVPVCLMHMQGSPENMQNNPEYQDVIGDIKSYFETRVAVAMDAGIGRDQLLLDPGFGFGKTLAHNLALLNNLDQLGAAGLPLLVGLSRKSMIGSLLEQAGLQDSAPDGPERVLGSVTLALVAACKGAHIVRVHDVKETVLALRIVAAAKAATGGASE
jgi:dihydropteroate synthase